MLRVLRSALAPVPLVCPAAGGRCSFVQKARRVVLAPRNCGPQERTPASTFPNEAHNAHTTASV